MNSLPACTFRAACVLCLIGLYSAQQPARAAQSIALEDEIAVSFTVPPGSYSNDFYFEVAEGTRKFRLDLNGNEGDAGDVDLYLRFAQPFPDTNSYGREPANSSEAVNWFNRLAHYSSAAAGNEEFLIISEHNVRPPTAGRWHLAVVNFSAEPVQATLRLDLRPDEAPAELQILTRFDLPCGPADGPDCVCDLSAWNDPEPVQPIAGNSGTTLGEQRRIAMQFAMDRVEPYLKSEVPLTVRACWAPLEGDATSAALSELANISHFINDPSLFVGGAGLDPTPALRPAYLPETGAWYPATVATKLAGTSLCRGFSRGDCSNAFDISITFNSRIDTNEVLGDARYYYGLDSASGVIDFVAQAMHPIVHQLGFISLLEQAGTPTRPRGTERLGRDDIYERQMVDISTDPPKRLSRMTTAERGAALSSGTALQWTSAAAVASMFNMPPPFDPAWRPDEPGVRMQARSPFRPGVNYLHVDEIYTRELMGFNYLLGPATSVRTLNLAKPMLEAVGWDPAPRSYPVAPPTQAGQWYDRDRPGHGIDFQRVYTSAEGYDIYSLFFYSYDELGEPEWFLAIGPVIDGIFMADTNEFGQSLVAYQYAEGRVPPQRADAGRRGQVRLDFNQPLDSFACSGGTPREGVESLAVFAWSIDGEYATWCMEPLVSIDDRSGIDLTGTWYAGSEDQGWGASIANAQRDAGELIFALIYYPDADGRGRWAYALTDDYQPGRALTLYERRGYCRTCETAELLDSESGQLELSLVTPTQENLGAGNQVGLTVAFQGATGGQFVRPSGTPLTLLSAPAQSP